MPLHEHPLLALWSRLERGEAVVAGVLSGTSADGIDVALLRFGASGAPVPLAFVTRSFPTELARGLRAVLDGRELGARGIAFLSRDLGRAFGDAARALAERERLALDLVGSHGQTVYHHDGNEPEGAATLQLGDGDFVAHTAGCPAVSDFRAADIAAGGEGAPLSGVLDPVLFPSLPRPAAILNLGGFANVTYLAAGEAPLAFDVGPANALLDGLARALLGRPYDEDGATAARARPSEPLLAELLRHPFFDRPPPKSTGRDTFGAPYVEAVLARGRALGLSPSELLASGTALVAESVAVAVARWLPGPPRELVLCGGGVANRALLAELERRTGIPARSSLAHGLVPEAREATFFAHLAVRCVLARPSTEPSVTGARRGGCLGKLSLPLLAGRDRDSTGVLRSQVRDPG
jgi:anhydro-N-acetylmuramic acid kinase